MKTTKIISILVCGILAVACGEEADTLNGRGNGSTNPGGGDPQNPGGTDPTDPALCSGREYTGFDAKKLHQDRVVAKVGVDRARMKPFTALSGDYPRVLGNTPASLQGSGPTFGAPPARWYEEPVAVAGSVALQTAYGIAYDGCLTYVAADASMAAAPTMESAKTACASMARKFWSKTPGPDEIDACANVAMNASAGETTVPRKWAYACASVLTSAGFLTY